ncbi:MAG TPA: hypothetical protein VIJ46_01830, partial [Rhabdochlamydiaceae bacterium]
VFLGGTRGEVILRFPTQRRYIIVQATTWKNRGVGELGFCGEFIGIGSLFVELFEHYSSEEQRITPPSISANNF